MTMMSSTLVITSSSWYYYDLISGSPTMSSMASSWMSVHLVRWRRVRFCWGLPGLTANDKNEPFSPFQPLYNCIPGTVCSSFKLVEHPPGVTWWGFCWTIFDNQPFLLPSLACSLQHFKWPSKPSSDLRLLNGDGLNMDLKNHPGDRYFDLKNHPGDRYFDLEPLKNNDQPQIWDICLHQAARYLCTYFWL